MESIKPWMRLKVKNDTFFLPDVDGVYFRNNVGSFRMEGTSVQSWIEKLLPVLNGQHTLESLTDGLPTPYKDRIYEVAGSLFDNGFLRDVSADIAHQLPTHILEYYAPQIEFVDHFIGSGAARFQTYRNAKVLVIGAGSMLVSLVGALLESGLSTVNFVITDEPVTDVPRLREFVAQYDGDVRAAVNDLSGQVRESAAMKDVVQAMDAVAYVSETGSLDELRSFEFLCNERNKLFLPAICVHGLGIVGPLAWPNHTLSIRSVWDAMWRQIHSSVFQTDLPVSSFTETAGAVLTNVLTFELFKAITGVDNALSDSHFYTLNPGTLEGKWHEFIPSHIGLAVEDCRYIQNLADRLTNESTTSSIDELLSYFARLTDTTSGIFHIWDEGDLQQLPLAQCRVQLIDPLSQGPADLLAQRVCTGLTHEEARREAGLTGIEGYVRRSAGKVTDHQQFMGIGAGSTLVEAIGRGLHQCLLKELELAVEQFPATVHLLQLEEIRDEKCKFYLDALRVLGINSVVGRGEDIFGFPVVWVGTKQRFAASVGFCLSMALQHALEDALFSASWDGQDKVVPNASWVVVSSTCIVHEAAPVAVNIEAWHGFDLGHEQIASAVEALAQSGKNITVRDLALAPFLTEVLAGVFGVSVHEGVSS